MNMNSNLSKLTMNILRLRHPLAVQSSSTLTSKFQNQCLCSVSHVQPHRSISTSLPLEEKTSGRFKVSRKHDNPLTYEEAFKPHDIGHIKSWNSMNTSNFPEFGLRSSQTLTEDIFIRRFLAGTWHNLFVSEILIKRQANLIRVSGIVQRGVPPRKMYFLIGYTEELLSHWIQSPLKLELQTIDSKKDVIFKYV